MKIYDCFIFFNENLLTEIRFNILDKFVDYFVVCESYYDHRGNKKGYLFDLNKFKKFNDKIIYVQIDEFPENLGVWERQDYEDTVNMATRCHQKVHYRFGRQIQ